MAVVGAAISAFAATTVGGVVVSTLARLALSVALSALLAPDKPTADDPGIRTAYTQTGDVNYISAAFGTIATAGTFVCPPMSHGSAGGTPNAYLTYVISLADAPATALSALIIDGQYATISGATHPSYGNKLTGKFLDKAWVIFKDGNQTTADSMLLAKYGTYPRRPWLADMIGRGNAYIILTFRYNRKVFPQLPKTRSVITGTLWYDPRKDTTVGGSGSHRANNQATWEVTRNPVVQIYNIKRGFTFPDGAHWGGYCDAAELPLSNWFAEMNKCDVATPVASGGTQPRYRTGIEFTVNDEPAAIEDLILRGCDGEVVDMGGYWKIRVGGPGLPVKFITDADIVITDPQSLEPYPSLDSIYNAVHTTYPSPPNLWEPKEGPPKFIAAYEAQDQGRRQVAELNLPAVSDKPQVQRLAKAFVNKQRKFIGQRITLPPEFAVLEPLDCIAWTSLKNGYTDKGFDIRQVADDVKRMNQAVGMRETDPTDYDFGSGEEIADDDAPDEVVEFAAQTVPGLAVVAQTLADATGGARRLQIKGTFTAADLDDVTAIEWEIRLAGTLIVLRRGQVTNVAAGEFLITSGLLPLTAYEVRARLVAVGRDTDWSAWLGATTPLLLLDDRDVGLPDIPGNLILNGRFASGDLRNWEDIDTGFSVISKAGGGNAQILACPTQFMMKMAFSLTSKEAFTKRFAVDPSDRIQITYRSAASLTTSLGPVPVLILGLEMYRADGTPIGSLFTGGINPSIWQYRTVEYSNFHPECVSARARVQYVMTAGSPSNLDIYMTNLTVGRRVSRRDVATVLGPFDLLNAYQTVVSVTNADDQAAADVETRLDFNCLIDWRPSTLTQMIVDFELVGPLGVIKTFGPRFRDSAPGVTQSFGFPVVIAPSGVVPETFSVRARRGGSTYDIKLYDVILMISSNKR